MAIKFCRSHEVVFQTHPYGGTSQKFLENSFFPAFNVCGLDVQSHVTSSFKVKMVP